MHVSQPTISAQVKALEDQLGEKLTRRDGCGLALTEAGRRVFEYAEQIFALGDELTASSRAKACSAPARGDRRDRRAAEARRLRAILRPVFHLDRPVKAIVTEASVADLLVQLAAHRLDRRARGRARAEHAEPARLQPRAGECGVVPRPPEACGEARRSSRALDGAPLLLPTHGTALRRSLDQWLLAQAFHAERRRRVRRRRAAAQDRRGRRTRRAACAHGRRARGARALRTRAPGRAEDCRQKFYAVSAERKLTHPAVTAITSAARTEMFTAKPKRAACAARPARSTAAAESALHHPERHVAPVSVRDRRRDPEQREMLEQVRLRERSGVEGSEAQFGRELRRHGLRRRVVAAVEHRRGFVPELRVEHHVEARRVKIFDARALRPLRGLLSRRRARGRGAESRADGFVQSKTILPVSRRATRSPPRARRTAR